MEARFFAPLRFAQNDKMPYFPAEEELVTITAFTSVNLSNQGGASPNLIWNDLCNAGAGRSIFSTKAADPLEGFLT